MGTENKNLRPLNKREKDVLAFISSYQLRTGISPSREEIAKNLKLKTLMSAQRAIAMLKAHKKIQSISNSKRSLEVIDVQSAMTELPLLGAVAAGIPIEAIESYDTIEVPRVLIRGQGQFFALKVKGNSMIEDHICDGDVVIIRKQETAEQGQSVVALLDNEATLKKFYQKKGRVELHPANASMKPIVVQSHHHLRILGIYTGLLRVQR